MENPGFLFLGLVGGEAVLIVFFRFSFEQYAALRVR